MRRAPSLQLMPHYPATGGTAVIAAAVTLFWWAGHNNIGPLVVTPQISHGEPWRLLTSIFPHADFIHLIFNLYFLWVFGTLVEEAWGTTRTMGIIILLGVGSSAAQFAVSVGGVGLSGVVYGLFGFLYVLTRNDRRFYLVVDQATVSLFVVWFFIGIALTYGRMMNIGNMAHGAGAALGALLGLAIAARRIARRRWYAAALVALMILFLAGATVARPYVNLSGTRLGRIVRTAPAPPSPSLALHPAHAPHEPEPGD